jgi:hypothetical protein
VGAKGEATRILSLSPSALVSTELSIVWSIDTIVTQQPGIGAPGLGTVTTSDHRWATLSVQFRSDLLAPQESDRRTSTSPHRTPSPRPGK